MKKKLLIALFIFIGESAFAGENPFSTAIVCFPAVNLNQAHLEFRIRETKLCQEGETLMEVRSHADGSVILYPTTLPSEPEEQKALENFKRYHGL